MISYSFLRKLPMASLALVLTTSLGLALSGCKSKDLGDGAPPPEREFAGAGAQRGRTAADCDFGREASRLSVV